MSVYVLTMRLQFSKCHTNHLRTWKVFIHTSTPLGNVDFNAISIFIHREPTQRPEDEHQITSNCVTFAQLKGIFLSKNSILHKHTTPNLFDNINNFDPGVASWENGTHTQIFNETWKGFAAVAEKSELTHYQLIRSHRTKFREIQQYKTQLEYPKMVHKEILYVTTLIIGHCFYIGYTGANEVIVQSDAKRPGDDSKIYEFKNKEILQQNEIPELILIKPIIEQKYDSLKGFIDAWDAIDHERLRLSAGESQIVLSGNA